MRNLAFLCRSDDHDWKQLEFSKTFPLFGSLLKQSFFVVIQDTRFRYFVSGKLLFLPKPRINEAFFVGLGDNFAHVAIVSVRFYAKFEALFLAFWLFGRAKVGSREKE